VRAAIEHNMLFDGGKRLWYAGPMFRHERPQKGRYRQFHQVGVEALGYAGPDLDIEHLLMTARLMEATRPGRIHQAGNQYPGRRRSARQSSAEADRLFPAHIDQLDADSQRRLHTNPLRILDSKNPAMQAWWKRRRVDR
jgi:histidyl-tRNA synthetase